MEMSRAKTVFALAIVVGCFAILWPRIFYPMLLNSVAPPQKHHDPPPAGFCCGVVFESDASIQFTAELCSLVLKNDLTMELTTLPLERGGRPPERVVTLCREELLKKCNVDINDVVRSEVDGLVDRRGKLRGLRAQNLTTCLKIHFGIDEESLLAKKSHHQHPILIPRHMRPERPPHLHPELMHPAMREKGRVLPTRTIEKQAKPGPFPGMRPPMGGPGHMVSPTKGDGTGSMGILMPVYTIGIVVFFVYTIMKIMFKKGDEQKPLIKDFHLDPEQRKFIFAEEYAAGGDLSMKEYIRRQELLEQHKRSRSRSKTPETVLREEVKEEEETVEEVPEEQTNSAKPVEDEVVEPEAVSEDVPIVHKMDTGDRELGEWYLDRGFVKDDKVAEASDSETEEDPVLSASEHVLQTALSTLKAQKEEEIDQLRKRLEETERAMERIVAQMGTVADKLSVPVTETPTPKTPARQDKAMAEVDQAQAASKGSSPDMEEYEVVGNVTKASEKDPLSKVLSPHCGVEVIDQPSPLTPTTEASFERILASETANDV